MRDSWYVFQHLNSFNDAKKRSFSNIFHSNIKSLSKNLENDHNRLLRRVLCLSSVLVLLLFLLYVNKKFLEALFLLMMILQSINLPSYFTVACRIPKQEDQFAVTIEIKLHLNRPIYFGFMIFVPHFSKSLTQF